MRPSWEAGHGEDIANDGLGLFVDAEGIAGDLAGVDGPVAGQHVAVEILHEQARGGPIVPVQALFPELALGLQHRAQHGRGKVPEVENLDGNARGHGYPCWTRWHAEGCRAFAVRALSKRKISKVPCGHCATSCG